MAEFVEVMKQKERMCNYHDSKFSVCVYCDIHKSSRTTSCEDFMRNNPQEAESLIMKWAEEHPIKTNADKFNEVFGFELDFMSISECVNHCILKCGEHKGCKECDKYNFWSKEYKE